jgi:hypothetical protein
MRFDHPAKVALFRSDRRYTHQSAGLRKSVLGPREPALTIVITGVYDARWLLEIEAIAVA